jgi:hypothetical protein
MSDTLLLTDNFPFAPFCVQNPADEVKHSNLNFMILVLLEVWDIINIYEWNQQNNYEKLMKMIKCLMTKE